MYAHNVLCHLGLLHSTCNDALDRVQPASDRFSWLAALVKTTHIHLPACPKGYAISMALAASSWALANGEQGLSWMRGVFCPR